MFIKRKTEIDKTAVGIAGAVVAAGAAVAAAVLSKKENRDKVSKKIKELTHMPEKTNGKKTS